MTVTNYVVPHCGFGEPRRLTVGTVNPEVFLQLLSSAEDNLLPVTLCGHSKSGFRVRYEEDIVGIIPASQSADYAELDPIIDAGLTPQATAEILLREDAETDGIPSFEVLLPEPGLCVPQNVPPAQRWGLLSGDHSLHITEFASSSHSLPEHPAQLLVRLSNSRRFFRRAIEIHVDDELVATIPHNQATRLSTTIAGFKHEGLIAVARAYFTPDPDSPTLTIYAEEGTPDTSLAEGTASVIAAAAGAAAATVANAGKAHAAISPLGGTHATAVAHTATSTASQGAQVLSLNSAAASATAGTQLAAASTGFKLACAAGAAVVVGGTAGVAFLPGTPRPSHDHVTDSAMTENGTSLHAAKPDRDIRTNSERSATAEAAKGTLPGARRSESQDVEATSRTLDHSAFPTAAETTVTTKLSEPTELPEPTDLSEPALPGEPAARTPHLHGNSPTADAGTPSPTPAPQATQPSRAPYSAPRTAPASTPIPATSAPDTSAQPTPHTPPTTAPPANQDRSDEGGQAPVTVTARPTATRTVQPPQELVPDHDGDVTVIEFG